MFPPTSRLRLSGSKLTKTHGPPSRPNLSPHSPRSSTRGAWSPSVAPLSAFASAEPRLIGRPMAKQPKNLAWSRAFLIGWLGSVWEAERSRAGLQCTPPASLHCTLVGKGGRRAGRLAGRPAGGKGVSGALSR